MDPSQSLGANCHLGGQKAVMEVVAVLGPDAVVHLWRILHLLPSCTHLSIQCDVEDNAVFVNLLLAWTQNVRDLCGEWAGMRVMKCR